MTFATVALVQRVLGRDFLGATVTERQSKWIGYPNCRPILTRFWSMFACWDDDPPVRWCKKLYPANTATYWAIR